MTNKKNNKSAIENYKEKFCKICLNKNHCGQAGLELAACALGKIEPGNRIE